MIRSVFAALGCLGLTAGCQNAAPAATGDAAELVQRLADAPEGADPDSCWGLDATPAVVETVTDQIMVAPAQLASDGSVARPAVYRTETRQAIVQARKETVFETPCPDRMTPDFVASLQRALQVRDHYAGKITGVMDGPTRGAIRRFQKPRGLDSGLLSLDSARALGLVALDRSAFGG